MQKKKRHGCLTAWLIYLIIAYSISAIIHFFNTDLIYKISPIKKSENLMLIYGSIGILGIVFSIMLFNWVKLGFWGILFISLILIIIIQTSNGYNLSQPFLVLLCLIILYFLLQIKKDNVSGWNNLK